MSPKVLETWVKILVKDIRESLCSSTSFPTFSPPLSLDWKLPSMVGIFGGLGKLDVLLLHLLRSQKLRQKFDHRRHIIKHSRLWCYSTMRLLTTAGSWRELDKIPRESKHPKECYSPQKKASSQVLRHPQRYSDAFAVAGTRITTARQTKLVQTLPSISCVKGRRYLKHYQHFVSVF